MLLTEWLCLEVLAHISSVSGISFVKSVLKRYNVRMQAHNLKGCYLIKVNFISSGKSKNLKKE